MSASLYYVSANIALAALLSVSCVTMEERLAKLPPPQIGKLTPASTLVGHGFQVQPSGLSAVSIDGSNFLPGCHVYFNDTPLITTSIAPGGLTGLVPQKLYASDGGMRIFVMNPDGQVSNTVIFTITPAPRIDRLYPDRIALGQPFNVQENGESALAIHGANFFPGAIIFFDGVPLETTFGNSGFISALVPQKLLRRVRVISTTVKNPDGGLSAAANFRIEKIN